MLCLAGKLVINPFDPNASMQQWLIMEHKIANRHKPNIILEVKTEPNGTEPTRDVTTGEFSGSALQLWNISHVYVA